MSRKRRGSYGKPIPFCTSQDPHGEHSKEISPGVVFKCLGIPPTALLPVTTEQHKNSNSSDPNAPSYSTGFRKPPLHPRDGHEFREGPPHAVGACKDCRFVQSKHDVEYWKRVDEEKAAKKAETEAKDNETEPNKKEVGFNEFLLLAKPGGWKAVPDSPNPFYVIAKEGVYVHVRNKIGRGVAKLSANPAFLPEMGAKGWFDLDMPKIPATICAQIVDFFQRIFDKHHTESEVILLIHKDTNEWAVMVPTQKTSYSAVDSRVDPAKVPKDYLIAGTMHSHCDFGAFHSGTDTGDARDMNGVHFTIGNLGKEKIQIASMVSLNGVNFEFKHEELADFSDLNAAQAPAEWDDFVIPTKDLASSHKPVGYELFDRYPKTTYKRENAVIPYGQYPKSTYQGQPGSWRQDQKPQQQPRTSTYWDWDASDSDDKAYYQWLHDRYLESEREEQHKDTPADIWRTWENQLTDKIIDAIITSGCITDEDMVDAKLHATDAKTVIYWQKLFLRKMSDLAIAMHDLGMDVTYQVDNCFKERNKK